MKIKRMLTSALAVICMFCMSIPAMAAVPAQDSDFIENQKASTIKAAEAIAYMDVDSASAEMQDRILAAREIIIEMRTAHPPRFLISPSSSLAGISLPLIRMRL